MVQNKMINETISFKMSEVPMHSRNKINPRNKT